MSEFQTRANEPEREAAWARYATDVAGRAWLSWLIKVRILILTFLLGIELVITNFTSTAVNKTVFISVIVVCYTIAVFHALLLTLWSEWRVQPQVQVFTDLVMATALVYVTGGIDSFFNFVYPLIIIIGSILLSRSWAYLTAALAFILYGGMLELCYFDVIRSYSATHPDLRSLQVTILINFFAYLLVAYLASRLSAKLRQVNVELEGKSGELEDLQALHENIVQSISTGLITTGIDGRVRLANPAAEALLHKSASELIGQPVASLFLDRLPDADHGDSHAEVRAVCKSGPRRQKTFSMAAVRLIAPRRGSVGHIYTFDDLTEIRRLEREVRQRDRLAAVGRMAAGIAHEIRNPLSSIAGSVRLLAEVATLDDEQKILVNIVNRESERLNNIISDFLTYTREKQYEFAQTDLVMLLDDTLTLLENRLKTTDGAPAIKIVRDMQVDHAFSVADRDRLKQVIWNISDNAIRAMPQGGTYTVSLQAEDADTWIIRFIDTGKGMAGSQMEKIFEPFQSEFEGGTGLGLAIVYQIVQGHGGRITVKSAPGQGAEFHLRLKRCAAPAEVQAEATVAEAAGVGKA